jgi:hypothetical protein
VRSVWPLSLCPRIFQKQSQVGIEYLLALLVATRGMSNRREHPVSPIRQRGLRSTTRQLHGMERLIRAFASFISIAPPYPGPDGEKPLPPIPTSSNSSPSDLYTPSMPGLSDRTPGATAWKPPAAWAGSSAPQQEESPHFTTQIYAPLLPEPSPGVFDMPRVNTPRPVDRSPARNPRPRPVDERAQNMPTPPPRWPTRTPPSNALSEASDSSISPTHYESDAPYPPVPSTPYHRVEISPEPVSPVTSPSPMEIPLRISNFSTKQKAFASLAIESFSDQERVLVNRFERSCSSDTRNEIVNTPSRGDEIRRYKRGGVVEQVESDDEELSDRMQQMSVAQDSHDARVDQYQDARAPPRERSAQGARRKFLATPKLPPNDPGLISRPLSWKGDASDSYASSPSSSTLNVRDSTRGSPKAAKYHKMTSWIPMQQVSPGSGRYPGDSEIPPRPASDPTVDARLSDSPSTNKEVHLPNFLASLRGLIPRNEAKASNTGPTSPFTTLRPLTTSTPPTPDRPTRLLRLPGGFEIVRQSPAPTSHAHSGSFFLDISPPLEASQHDLFTEYPPHRRPSSLYSYYSQPAVAPSRSVNRPPRDSLSTTSSPPTSPLAHEIPVPRTPPTRPTRAPQVDSPTRRTRALIDKARDAREAWKRHQKNAKHDRLKQSISVLGPMDPNAAGYAEGREVGRGR